MEGELLADQVEQLLATGAPSVTMLTGEPGIGKSHLLHEMRRAYLKEDSIRIVHTEASRCGGPLSSLPC